MATPHSGKNEAFESIPRTSALRCILVCRSCRESSGRILADSCAFTRSRNLAEVRSSKPVKGNTGSSSCCIMMNASEIPTFAVVGHPNEGKSSVVATLTEDDSLRITDFPGETTVCSDYSVRVDDEILIRFLDTPGFQYPQKTLEWMQQHSAQKQHPAHAFVEAFREDPEHHHDVELLIPLAAGAGIIYVVDGSRPMRKNDVCEMEILRMTGNPRMALINPKEGDDSFLQTWKENCAKSFNLTRIFNAHQASFVERMALLESLKRMHQDWEPAMIGPLVDSGKTVLVDVTAAWCITCKANKSLVIEQAPVAPYLRQLVDAGQLVLLQADWTRPNDDIAAFLAAYQRYGIPFNIVYGPHAVDGIQLGELLTSDAVLAALNKAMTGSDNL